MCDLKMRSQSRMSVVPDCPDCLKLFQLFFQAPIRRIPILSPFNKKKNLLIQLIMLDRQLTSLFIALKSSGTSDLQLSIIGIAMQLYSMLCDRFTKWQHIHEGDPALNPVAHHNR